jgi:hypothetical protein
MTPEEQRDRGQRAQRLLDDELLREALDAIESEVVRQWENCPARDSEGKEALWQLMKTSKKFRGLLTGYVQTGRLAADNIKRMEEESRMKRLLRRVR